MASPTETRSGGLVTFRPKTLQYYNGLLIHADLGVHEQARALFEEYVPAGSTVLDAGAGAGALTYRLADHGYRMTALDVDPEKWTPHPDIDFYVLDLDAGIKSSVAGPFDAVCCVEVIEHVENPWNLLRELHEVVRPGGHVILSTPNITSFLSRWLFLRSGRFHQFFEQDLVYGHITPLTAQQVTNIAERTGFAVREVRPGGYLSLVDLSERSLGSITSNVARLVAYPLMKGQKRGWCVFFVLQRE